MSETDRSALELQALQRVIASGTRALDLDVVLDRCIEQAMEVARADAGTIYLRDQRRGVFALAASRNAPPDADAGDHVDRRAAPRRPLPLRARRASAVPARVGTTRIAAGFTHALVVLLAVEDRRIGFLGLLFRGKPTLADSTTRTLEAIAGFEAVALESARVHQQVELRALGRAHAQRLRRAGSSISTPTCPRSSSTPRARSRAATAASCRRSSPRDGVEYVAHRPRRRRRHAASSASSCR